MRVKETIKKKAFEFLHINPFVLMAFCFFIYIPKFNIPQWALSIIALGIPALYVICNFKLFLKLSSRQLMLLLFAALLVMLSVFVPILHDTMDFSYLSIMTTFFKRIIVYLALLCLIIRVHGKDHALQYFLYYFAAMHVVYVIGTLLMVFIPGLKDFWLSLIAKEEILENMSAADSSTYMFRIGWQGFSGFRLTLYCTLSVIFILYLRYAAKPAAISGRQFWLCFLGCVLGNMFYGRSGLMVTIVVCLLAFIYWNRKNIKRIIIFGAIVLIGILGVSALGNIPGLRSWYEWMSSPIINLLTTGDMQDGSFDKLQEMHQVEISNEAFTFGDGYFMDGNKYYKDTDVGFIRNILFWGIIGAILSYSATIYAIWGFGKLDKLLVLQLLIVFLAFEYKGDVYYEFLPLAFIVETALNIENEKVGSEKYLEG